MPILIEDAAMPNSDELPKSLRALAFRNAAVIRSDPDFHRDMQRIMKSIGHPTLDKVAVSPAGTGRAVNLRPGMEKKQST